RPRDDELVETHEASAPRDPHPAAERDQCDRGVWGGDRATFPPAREQAPGGRQRAPATAQRRAAQTAREAARRAIEGVLTRQLGRPPAQPVAAVRALRDVRADLRSTLLANHEQIRA